MDIKTVTINLKNLMNKWFYTREQIHELLEDYVTVNNQGILSVGIPSPEKITLTTTNNAITTADMAEVTAKVTDNSNTPSYGVPVEFVNRATREVLHHDTTNSDGECVFEYFTEEAEILPLQARISNDYLFKDDGRLNSHNSWDSVVNSTIVRYDTYSCLQSSESNTSPSIYSLVLSGYTDITFKVKFYNTSARMGLISCSSTGTSPVVFKYFSASQLGLSTDTWYTIQFSCLDDRIIIYCKETGNVKVEWIDSLPSYYKFYMAAQVKGTSIDFCDVKINRASDDLSMFIKDNGNLMDYNVWSGTDYLKNTMGFLPTDATVSSDYTFSTIGERSLKITTTGTKYQEVNLKNIQGNASETFAATIDILNNTGETVELRLFEIGGGHNTVNISSNESVQTVSITRTLGTDCTLRAILILRYPLTVYIDNVRLDKR